MQSIVVGTDGSPSAEVAVRRAIEVAKGGGAVVHLVTAFPDVPSYRGASAVAPSATRSTFGRSRRASWPAPRASSLRTVSTSRRPRGRGTQRR